MNMKKTRLYIALLSSYSLHIKTLMLAWFFLLPLFLSAIMNAEDENHASNLPSGELSNAILKQSDWWQTEQQNIRQMEYDVSYQEHCLIPGGKAGYHMANRAQNLRAYFYPEGLKVLRRMEKKPSWICGFQLAGFGRQGNVQLLQMDSKLTVEKNLIEYHHGPLIERYENREDGIKQSFIIAEAPTGIGPLVLVVRLSSNLSPQLTTRDSAVRFLHNGTAVIKYGGLEAIDATGRKLRAQLSLVGDQLHILINDASSVYPVTIDPLLTGLSSVPDWTAESDQAWAYFGCSVSTAGDVNGDGYTDVIIGAYYYDNGEGNEGRAFLYLGSPTGLSAIPDWIAESNQTDAYFGMSVFTAGDVNGDDYSDVIVGAPWYTNGELEEGRAFVYHGSASGLSTVANWTAESNQADAEFGRSVSTAGDINGDGYADVIVGAPWYTNGELEEGRAFVYHGSAFGLSTIPDWTAESNQARAEFGWSVSTAGDVNGNGYADVIVGAFWYDNGERDEGCAFVYHGSASGLSTVANWTAESNQADAEFGRSVSTAADVNGDGYADVIVGAPSYYNGESQEGRAFVYHGSAFGLSTIPDWIAESNQADAYFGMSVSTAGDVNGDGYSDVIVGAPWYTNGELEEGRAFVYHGSASRLSTIPDWTAESNQANAGFGRSVSTAGDINGDSYADAIVGAPWYDNGESWEGRAFVYHGSASPPPTAADSIWSYYE